MNKRTMIFIFVMTMFLTLVIAGIVFLAKDPEVARWLITLGVAESMTAFGYLAGVMRQEKERKDK